MMCSHGPPFYFHLRSIPSLAKGSRARVAPIFCFPHVILKTKKIFLLFFVLPRRLDRAAKFHLARRRNEYEAPEINSVKFHSSEIYDKASNKNTACPSAHCWMIVITSQVSISSSHITVQRTLISETLITVRHSKVQRPPG